MNNIYTSPNEPVRRSEITTHILNKENNEWLESLIEANRKLNLILRNITRNESNKNTHSSFELIELEDIQNKLVALKRQVQIRKELLSQYPNSHKLSKTDVLMIDHLSTKEIYNRLSERLNKIFTRYY